MEACEAAAGQRYVGVPPSGVSAVEPCVADMRQIELLHVGTSALTLHQVAHGVGVQVALDQQQPAERHRQQRGVTSLPHRPFLGLVTFGVMQHNLETDQDSSKRPRS